MHAAGERLKQAVLRLSEIRAARPGEPTWRLVDEVALALDLTPAESESLLRLASEAQAPPAG